MQKEAEAGSDSEEEDLADGDLSAVKPGMLEPCKLVSRADVLTSFVASLSDRS